MSVRGFNTGSGIEQYDYDYLANKPDAPTKESIGLGNVDNTSDMNKPVSTAQGNALSQKVDKVSGMGLSSEDYTSAEKEKLGDLPTNEELEADLAGKASAESVTSLNQAITDLKGVSNQLAPALDTSWSRQNLTYTVSDSVLTCTINTVGPQTIYKVYDSVWEHGHKYYVSALFNPSEAATINVGLKTTTFTSDVVVDNVDCDASSWTRMDGIISPTDSANGFRIGMGSNKPMSVGASLQIKNLMCIDLTSMFGAGFEPTKEDFLTFFPDEFYAKKDRNNVTSVQTVDLLLKLNKTKVYQTIEEMQSNFIESDALCYVLSDTSEYCEGFRGNYYVYKGSAEFDEIALDHGGCAALVIPPFAPPKSNTECMNQIIDIAESYCGVEVSYESSNGPFSNENNGIQCSQFVNTLLQGVPYRKSKLNRANDKNTHIDGWCRWISKGDTNALSANQLAHFAAAHGWLHQTSYLKNTEPGDVLFFYKTATDSTAVNWKGIVHVALVVARIGHETLVVNAGGIAETGQMIGYHNYPGDASDAVNYYVLNDDETEMRNSAYGLFGFARFPVYYPDSYSDSGIIEIASGAVASFDDGAYHPIKSLNIQLSGGTTGLSSLSVTSTGKNMIGRFKSWSNNNIMYTANEDGSVTLNGTGNGTSAQRASFPFWLPAGTFTVYGFPSNARNGAGDILVRKSSDSSIIARGYPGSGSATFTLTEPTKLFYSIRSLGTTYVHENVVYYPMILRSDETDTSFESPATQSVDVSFPSEVTNFNLDFTKGILTDTDNGTEYKLMPFRLKTTEGKNYIFSNTGDVTVEYYADAKLYIDKMIS